MTTEVTKGRGVTVVTEVIKRREVTVMTVVIEGREVIGVMDTIKRRGETNMTQVMEGGGGTDTKWREVTGDARSERGDQYKQGDQVARASPANAIISLL